MRPGLLHTAQWSKKLFSGTLHGPERSFPYNLDKSINIKFEIEFKNENSICNESTKMVKCLRILLQVASGRLLKLNSGM